MIFYFHQNSAVKGGVYYKLKWLEYSTFDTRVCGITECHVTAKADLFFIFVKTPS
jgi:hypothetical protein